MNVVEEIVDLDIDEMVAELCDIRKRLDNMKEAEYELEKQVLAWMESEGATIRKTQNHSVMVEERGVKYRPEILNNLITEELVGPLDLEGVYEPAHQKTIDVPASWNMAKGRKLKELGTRQREIVEGARFVGRHAVTIKQWEPTKSGANAGQKRDPSVDFNYRWEVAQFIDGPSRKRISVNGSDIVQAKVDDSTVLMLQREFISNDRTALMQAVAFGASDSSNILTEVEVMRIASMWGDLLNERAISRLTQATIPTPPGGELKGSHGQGDSPVEVPKSALVQNAQAMGAIVTDVQPEPVDYVVHNIEDVKKVLSSKGISNAQVSQVMNAAGFARGSDWLEKNGEDYAGLLALIENGLNEDSSIW
jgi:hypothetical protein